jgi:uncharacterized protein
VTGKKAANRATEGHLKDKNAEYWIEKLRLEPHPEGGYFRQTYKSEMLIAPTDSSAVAKAATRVGQPEIPDGSQSPHPVAESATRAGQPARTASTAIYFLLEGESFSAFHRLRSDEMWHFYAGSPLVVHVIDVAGEYSSILLGNDPGREQVFQALVKAGCWFASEIAPDSHSSTASFDPHRAYERGRNPAWALVGCTVAPGFEFEDFELAKRQELAREFPQHRELIERLTRQ